MGIKITDLLEYRYSPLTGQAARVEQMLSVAHAKRNNIQTAFLSHSHKDAHRAKYTQRLLAEHGWVLYIDWEDSTMPDEPDAETAKNLQDRIKSCDWFLYLATENSSKSRWCPWEIGFADEVKGKKNLVIIPIEENDGTRHGNEYLQLYQRIDTDSLKKLAVFQPHQTYYGQALNEMRLY